MKRQANDSIIITREQRRQKRQAYCLGAVSTINQMLIDQKRQTPITPGALVPVKEGLIAIALNAIGSLRVVNNESCIDMKDLLAYCQGQAGGRGITIRQGIGGSSSKVA